MNRISNFINLKSIKVIMIFISFMTFFISTNNSCATAIPRDGLVGEWLLDGNANDTSGNGYNGVEYNIIWENSNRNFIHKSYKGNGISSYIEIPTNAVNNISSGSISVWSKRLSINNQETIINKTQIWTSDQMQLIFEATGGFWDNKIRWRVSDQTIHSVLPILDNDWHHIVGIWGPSGMKLYIDGIINNFNNSDVQLGNNNAQLFIGANQIYQMAYHSGNIELLRIYNRVLTDNEIQALYNEGTPSSSASWRWSCVEQKSATNFGASVVNVNGKNAIKVNWQNPDGSTTTKVTKNYAQDIDIQSGNNEYLDYDIEIGKTYTYYLKSINNCGNFGTTDKIEVTYDNKPKFDLVNLDSSNNSLSLFLTKYGNFGTDNIRVAGYLTSNDGFNTRFQPKINEQYNYGYIKVGNYHLVLQVEDMNGNTYANFKIEKDIKITQTSSAKMDFALSADDSGPDYINYKYSLTTKYFNFKNASAKLSLIDTDTKTLIKEEKLNLTSDNNGITSNTFLFKESYLSSNKTYKRMLKLTIGDSGEAIYSNVYDFKVGGLSNFELNYNSGSKIFSWERQNNPSLVYNLLCRSNDGGTNISKTLNNTLSYKDNSKSLIENGNYSCFVNYFNNGYIYKSNEIVFGTDLSLTRRGAYEAFMKIYNNGASIDYDKEALRLGIINNTSEKGNKVKWLEYANILFKIYGSKVFSDKSYDKATYDEFSKLLVNLIGIEDGGITKDEFNDLKQYLSENNDRFKTRVQNVFNYKDEILQYIKQGRTQAQLDYLKKIIKNYFSINY